MKFSKYIPLFLVIGTFGLSQVEASSLSLWPSVVAIFSVILWRSALAGLLVGAVCGTILLAGGNPTEAFTRFFSTHLLPSLQSEWNLSVLLFTFLLGGFAALLEKGRGFEGILGWLLKDTENGSTKVQWSAFSMGAVCFFDGLASSLLTGKSIRPLADQTGVSRAKLSYIVDSTSSSVACVAIMSTWIAYQLSMVREGYARAGIGDVEPFAIFLKSIPMNFYCWFTMALLVVVIWKGWNFGPMAKHEAKAQNENPSGGGKRNLEGQAWRALLPLGILVTCLFAGLYMSGTDKELFPVTFPKLKNAFGSAQSNWVLLYSTVIACVVAYICNSKPIQNGKEQPGEVFMDGIQRFFAPCLILIAAWCLSSTLGELEASAYLSSLLKGNLPTAYLPVAVFLLGVLISFTTGTSWGTMGVLMPLALPVAFTLSPGNESLVACIVAAVFSGAVFGDHCSPLSDTTIVSAMACDLEPFDHVHTQLPYAVMAAAIATVCGFIPLGLGVSPWLCLLAGIGCLALLPMLHQTFSSNSKHSS